jgi:hypothetical protein
MINTLELNDKTKEKYTREMALEKIEDLLSYYDISKTLEFKTGSFDAIFIDFVKGLMLRGSEFIPEGINVVTLGEFKAGINNCSEEEREIGVLELKDYILGEE